MANDTHDFERAWAEFDPGISPRVLEADRALLLQGPDPDPYVVLHDSWESFIGQRDFGM